jgi:hypothetical protein
MMKQAKPELEWLINAPTKGGYRITATHWFNNDITVRLPYIPERLSFQQMNCFLCFTRD